MSTASAGMARTNSLVPKSIRPIGCLAASRWAQCLSTVEIENLFISDDTTSIAELDSQSLTSLDLRSASNAREQDAKHPVQAD